MRPNLLLFAGLLWLAGGAATVAAERPLTLDPQQSHVDVIVKATMDSFTGRLAAYEPEIRIDDEGRIASARLAFHFRDVLTGKAKRDRAMHEWQHTEEFPDGEFVLATLVPGQGGTARARGRLTLHGMTREVEFPVSVTTERATWVIDGDAAIDVRDFGLPVIRMMGLLKVDPIVHVKFHLQGRAG